MSVWTDRIEESEVGTLAAKVRELAEAGETSDEQEEQHLYRAGRIAAQVEWVLENADPTLIAADTLGKLTQGLTASVQHLEAWRAGNGIESLVAAATTAIDQVVDGLSCIPVPASAAEASTEIGSLRRSVGQHRSQIEREVDGLRASVEEAVAELEARREAAATELANRVEEAMGETAALRDEVDRLREEMTTLLASARTVETNQQAAFNTSQTSNQEAFAKLLNDAASRWPTQRRRCRRKFVRRLKPSRRR